ncbi:MAG: fumarylacetoacetate hydrolase family protein [Porticoccaceae bacterium]|nr:fumarylacetoacetate hydrolase family protein [Porticoccaceae bacterium]OUS08044.1 2-keto-4-pentenoate hydratase [Gammaproteobacteria bacterium 54_18_T64]
MKLASLKSSARDGHLIVVNRSLSHYLSAADISPSLQHAIENWQSCEQALHMLYDTINKHPHAGFQLDQNDLCSPLPRAFQWLDGSAYLSHVERVRRARGVEMPDSFLSDPLMYQGGSDHFLGPKDTICMSSEADGIDFEAEVAIICDDVPMGTNGHAASEHIKLILLVNDVSLRQLIPSELAKGFGFINGKPPTAFSPVAVTPDELGTAWHDDKVHLPLLSTFNQKLFGEPNAGVDMQFNFAELIAHGAKTRALRAGTIIGSGTVSNYDASAGYSCLVEKRVVEIVESGLANTEFMLFGDYIRIEMLDPAGASIFGAIDQEVRSCKL